MAERRIIITEPPLNTDAYRDFTTHTWENQDFPVYASRLGVSPLTHPRAVDLCAGNGRWAVRLTENGWSPKNITCIDFARPNPPLVDGLSWVHWDLEELGWRLHIGGPIPAEIEQTRGSFDCVVTSCAGNGGGMRYQQYIFDFLARDGGFIWPDDTPYLKASTNTTVSNPVGAT